MYNIKFSYLRIGSLKPKHDITYKRNIEARFHNNYWRGKVIIIIMSVCL